MARPRSLAALLLAPLVLLLLPGGGLAVRAVSGPELAWVPALPGPAGVGPASARGAGGRR